MKLTILILSLLLILASCQKDPVSTHQTDNSEIKVSKLFTYDSCTVYRFYDNETHYFVKCPCNCSVTSKHWVQTGKNGHYEDRTIETQNK